MTGTKNDLINYRIARAKDTYDDASILAEREKWNSTINRLYYAAYYAVMALLLDSDLKPTPITGQNQTSLSISSRLARLTQNTVKCILNCSLGDKKEIMTIYSIFTKTT